VSEFEVGGRTLHLRLLSVALASTALAWRQLTSFVRLQILTGNFRPFIVRDCRSCTPPEPNLQRIAGPLFHNTTSPHSTKTDNMDSQSSHSNPEPFAPVEEYTKLVNMSTLLERLYFLSEYSRQDSPALNKTEAAFIPLAISVEKALASYRAKIEARHRIRHSGSHSSDKARVEDVWRSHDLAIALVNRLIFLLCLCFAAPLWSILRFASSSLGTYHVQAQWALLGFALGFSKSALAMVIAAIRAFAAAPRAAMKSFYDSEMDLFRLSVQLNRSSHRASFGTMVGSIVPVSSWAAVVVQAVSFCLGGVGIVGRCVMFFCCFQILAAVAHRLNNSRE
jgi:hypothetical protein